MPIKSEDKAMFEDSLPVNSIPFLKRMLEILEEGETNTPRTLSEEDLLKFKSNLYIILGQTFTQLFQIDSLDLFTKIREKMIMHNLI